MDTKVLFKNRSITSCMKAAYDYTGSHFTSLIKKTWWATLIYAILMAITVYFRMPNKGLHDWGVENPITSYLLQTIIYAMTWFAFCLSSAAIWTWLTKTSFWKNLLKFTIVYIIFEIIGGFAIGFGYGGTSAIYQAMATKAMAANSTLTLTYAVTGIVAIILLVIVALLALPFAHIIPHVMLKQKEEKLKPWSTYKEGVKHLGSIFLMGFLGTIIICIISCIVLIPTFIMSWAQMSSQMGALGGDPLGVPAYFTPLLLIVLSITIFVLTYVASWLGISYAYLYGSNTNLEKKKKELQNTNEGSFANQ